MARLSQAFNIMRLVERKEITKIFVEELKDSKLVFNKHKVKAAGESIGIGIMHVETDKGKIQLNKSSWIPEMERQKYLIQGKPTRRGGPAWSTDDFGDTLEPSCEFIESSRRINESSRRTSSGINESSHRINESSRGTSSGINESSHRINEPSRGVKESSHLKSPVIRKMKRLSEILDSRQQTTHSQSLRKRGLTDDHLPAVNTSLEDEGNDAGPSETVDEGQTLSKKCKKIKQALEVADDDRPNMEEDDDTLSRKCRKFKRRMIRQGLYDVCSEGHNKIIADCFNEALAKTNSSNSNIPTHIIERLQSEIEELKRDRQATVHSEYVANVDNPQHAFRDNPKYLEEKELYVRKRKRDNDKVKFPTKCMNYAYITGTECQQSGPRKAKVISTSILRSFHTNMSTHCSQSKLFSNNGKHPSKLIKDRSTCFECHERGDRILAFHDEGHRQCLCCGNIMSVGKIKANQTQSLCGTCSFPSSEESDGYENFLNHMARRVQAMIPDGWTFSFDVQKASGNFAGKKSNNQPDRIGHLRDRGVLKGAVILEMDSNGHANVGIKDEKERTYRALHKFRDNIYVLFTRIAFYSVDSVINTDLRLDEKWMIWLEWVTYWAMYHKTHFPKKALMYFYYRNPRAIKNILWKDHPCVAAQVFNPPMFCNEVFDAERDWFSSPKLIRWLLPTYGSTESIMHQKYRRCIENVYGKNGNFNKNTALPTKVW